MTGQIGEVMQESMQAALTWVRSNAAMLGLAEDFTKEIDLHIHVPAGAIPKDGPSAGVTMATVLASLLTDTPVRPLTAMTGEITLSGNVLPVGGIKEKVLAARRAGVETIILPADNRQDVEEDLTPEQIAGSDRPLRPPHRGRAGGGSAAVQGEAGVHPGFAGEARDRGCLTFSIRLRSSSDAPYRTLAVFTARIGNPGLYLAGYLPKANKSPSVSLPSDIKFPQILMIPTGKPVYLSGI